MGTVFLKTETDTLPGLGLPPVVAWGVMKTAWDVSEANKRIGVLGEQHSESRVPLDLAAFRQWKILFDYVTAGPQPEGYLSSADSASGSLRSMTVPISQSASHEADIAEPSPEVLNWDVCITAPRPRASGVVRVRMRHAGRSKPIPSEDPFC